MMTWTFKLLDGDTISVERDFFRWNDITSNSLQTLMKWRDLIKENEIKRKNEKKIDKRSSLMQRYGV